MILSLPRAQAYEPRGREVCISITDPNAAPARVSPAFRDVLRISFTDIVYKRRAGRADFVTDTAMSGAQRYGIAQRLAVLSHVQFQVNPGSLFPSLYRLEQDGRLNAEWRPTENNRWAKYYRLTASGRRQLEHHRERWDRVSFAVTSVLQGA